MACTDRPIYVEDLAPYAFTCDGDGLIRPSLSLEEQGALFLDDMWGVMAGSWITRISTGSRVPISRDNGWFQFTTGAVATNEESVDWNDILQFTNTKQPAFSTRIQIPDLSDIEVAIGLIGAAATDYIRFFYSASSGITNWRAQVSDAGAINSITSATAVTTNEVVLSWRFNSDTEVEFFIDGVSAATVGLNVPVVGLQPYIAVLTEAAAPKVLYVDYVRIVQDRV